MAKTTKKTGAAKSGKKAAEKVAAEKAVVAEKAAAADAKAEQNAKERIKEGNRKLVVGAVIGGAAICGVIAAAGLSSGLIGRIVNGITSSWWWNSPTWTGSFTLDGNSANFTEGSIAEVASRVTPAVVSVKTESRTKGYFGQDTTSSAAGTGMIVTEDGYVITNKHVVDGASNISIVMDDGTQYDDVKLLATDPVNDVAYLKISDVSGLPTVTLGNSKTVTVGQQVIAIGNALGQFQNTVTEGIVSGIGRTIVAGDSSASDYYETLSDMIQTDASINAGNSGGPLVNAAGEVIGINTAVSASANGLGFAIPISAVKGMLKNIIANGKAERAFLGVSYTNLTADTAKSYDLPVKYGAYVHGSSAVVSGSPADKAGIREGDVLVAVNGAKVGENGTLSSLIAEYTVGDKVTLTVLRGDKTINMDVTLTAYPKSTNSSESSSSNSSLDSGTSRRRK